MVVFAGSSRGAAEGGKPPCSRVPCHCPSRVHTQPCSLADALHPAVLAAALSLLLVHPLSQKSLLLPHMNVHPAPGSVAAQAGAALKLQDRTVVL